MGIEYEVTDFSSIIYFRMGEQSLSVDRSEALNSSPTWFFRGKYDLRLDLIGVKRTN